LPNPAGGRGKKRFVSLFGAIKQGSVGSWDVKD